MTSRSGSKQTAQLLGRRLGERTQGDEQHDRELLQAKSEMAEEAERLDVGPLRVVDHQQHGLLAGEVRAQPEQAVPLSEAISDRLTGVASSRGLRGRGSARPAPRRPSTISSALPVRLWRAGARAADAPRRRRSSPPARSPAPRGRARPRRRPAPRRPKELGLADARCPVHDHEPTGSRVDRVVERGELAVALAQHWFVEPASRRHRHAQSFPGRCGRWEYRGRCSGATPMPGDASGADHPRHAVLGSHAGRRHRRVHR